MAGIQSWSVLGTFMLDMKLDLRAARIAVCVVCETTADKMVECSLSHMINSVILQYKDHWVFRDRSSGDIVYFC